MNARRPKPTELKERTNVRPSLGLSRLFASANELVPVDPPVETRTAHDDEDEIGRARKVATKRKPTPPPTLELAKEDRTLRLDDPRLTKPADEEYGTAIRVANKPKPKPLIDLDVTKTMKIQPFQTTATTPEVVPHRTSVSKLKQKAESKSDDRTKNLALICLIPAIALIAYALLGNPFGESSANTQRKSALSDTEIKDRLQYYQTTLGQRLNRQRIGVEIDNYREAPPLTGADHKVKPPSMLDGLPLEGEANNFQRKKDLPYDPTYSEAKTGYGLQEEQERRKFEKEAERAWVNEFVENARRDGYDVEIDQYGRVKASRIPESKRPPEELTTSDSFGNGAQ